MVCASNCMEHYLSKLDYMEVYLLLLQIVSKYIIFIVEWYAQPNYMKVYLLLLQIVSKYIFLIECMGSFYCGMVVMVCTAKLYGSLFIATTNYVQVYFSNTVYESFYCGMVVMVCTAKLIIDHYFFH